jgi:hypothetical protein
MCVKSQVAKMVFVPSVKFPSAMPNLTVFEGNRIAEWSKAPNRADMDVNIPPRQSSAK